MNGSLTRGQLRDARATIDRIFNDAAATGKLRVSERDGHVFHVVRVAPLVQVARSAAYGGTPLLVMPARRVSASRSREFAAAWRRYGRMIARRGRRLQAARIRGAGALAA